MQIAVIGAGISGLACARGLTAGGVDVTVFERDGFLGGRAGTRHMPWGSFDHGAQYFTARGSVFRFLLKHWIDQGSAALWSGALSLADHSPGNFQTPYVGTPGMSGIAAVLAAGLQVQRDCEVGRMTADPHKRWRLERRDGSPLGVFDWVVSSAPAPQTAALLAPVAAGIAEEASRVRYAPCWTVMARCESWHAESPAFSRPTESPLGWIAHDGGKPGRLAEPTAILQASPAWSREYLTADPDSVRSALLAEWARLGGGRATDSAAHLWPHALAETPLGIPYLLDIDGQVGACGDWCSAPRVESAFESGLALSRAIRKAIADGHSRNETGA